MFKLVAAAATAALASDRPATVTPRPHRLTTTIMLPMRDGVKLHTVIDQPAFPKAPKLPAVMERSPYGENQEELIALVFAEVLGYASVRQDQRGTGGSEGNFSTWHDARDDAYDTIEYLTAQPWSNGEVYTTGVSADCIDEYAQLSNPHPALRASLNVFGSTQGWETFFVGGAYREALVDGWLHKTVPSQFKELDAFVRSEEQPGTPWWQQLNGTLWYGNVNWPSVHWAGWYDIFQQGNLAAYEGFQHRASPAAVGQAKLVVDPLGHCQAGASYFTHDLIFGRVLLPFLMALDLMKDDSITNRTWPAVPENVGNVTFFIMGSSDAGASGQYWTSLPDFPEPTRTAWYLQPAGGLSTSLPPAAGPTTVATYVSDPTNPVPSLGGDNLEIACGPLDQSPLESRHDVVVFTTPPLTSELAVTGELTATLYVTSSALDTDFVVKLIDVYPEKAGKTNAALIADGIARMKWRLFPSTNEPQLLSGDATQVYQVNLTLWHTSYIFSPGHSVRVHVASSNWPRFFPNQQTGANMTTAGSDKNVTATNSVLFSADHPSAIVLPVVDAKTQMPPFPVEATMRSMAARHAPRWAAHTGAAAAPAADEEATVDAFMAWASERLQAVGRTHLGPTGRRV